MFFWKTEVIYFYARVLNATILLWDFAKLDFSRTRFCLVIPGQLVRAEPGIHSHGCRKQNRFTAAPRRD
jgi:hypothetical protein